MVLIKEKNRQIYHEMLISACQLNSYTCDRVIIDPKVEHYMDL